MSKQLPVAEARSLETQAPVRIVTSYARVADFIHGFCRSVDERHVLIGVTRPHTVGARLEFAACLSTGQVVFRGTGTIVELVASKRRGVAGAKIAIDELTHESRVMHRCLLMARQALLLTQASDLAAFDGEVPDFARSALPRVAPAVAAGTQPRARTVPRRSIAPVRGVPVLASFGDDVVATRASTTVAGVIHVRPRAPLTLRSPQPPALPWIDDEPDTSEVTGQLLVPPERIPREDVASAAPVHSSRTDTERIFLEEPDELLPHPARWPAVLTLVLLGAAAAFVTTCYVAGLL